MSMTGPNINVSYAIGALLSYRVWVAEWNSVGYREKILSQQI